MAGVRAFCLRRIVCGVLRRVCAAFRGGRFAAIFRRLFGGGSGVFASFCLRCFVAGFVGRFRRAFLRFFSGDFFGVVIRGGFFGGVFLAADFGGGFYGLSGR